MKEVIINAIIQARMGSTRLPGKVMMELEGVPVLGHIVNRLHSIPMINKVIIATSTASGDDSIAQWCLSNDIICVRGDEYNVLERFVEAATCFPADIYIRATGDNPMIDVNLITQTINFFLDRNLTYTSYKGFPLGSGVEVFSDFALKAAASHAKIDYELEHVTPYMYLSMPERRVEYYASETDDSRIRMTIDTEEDLLFATNVFSRLYKDNHNFGVAEIKELLSKERNLVHINESVHQKKLGE